MFCPACVRGPARKGSAADKKASAAALSVTPSRKPRTCGEKPKVMNLVLVRPGSPPHVRGKADAPSARFRIDGITPACAGKRRWPGCSGGSAGDHPRVCGENALSTFSSRKNSGSPPHMRGKSSSPPWAISPARDHPRVCGEKSHQRGLGLLLLGSPPHVRGKGVRYLCIVLFAGITPACAGKRSGPLPAAVPAGLAGSCPASRPSQFPPRMTVIKPRP